MTIPEYITRAQLGEAFKALGLDASRVMSFSGRGEDQFICVQLAPEISESKSVHYSVAKIPIVDGAPETAADLIGELRRQEVAG